MKLLLTILCLLTIQLIAQSQGCVAIRSAGGMCMAGHANDHATESKWLLNVNTRYFKSFRHFRGEHEEKQRVAQNTEVINHTTAVDFTLTRNLKKAWSLAVGVPVVSNARSSLYEHDGKTRHSTHSFGIGDMRIVGYKWLWNPAMMPKGNIQAGIGIKLPTGDYRYQDYFYRNDSTQALGPVDQSIQLGDGGTGFSTELNAYYNISRSWGTYANAYYLFNPREQNGTSTARGGTSSLTQIRNGSSVMSVPDQYMLRAGANFQIKNIQFSAGARMEGIPSEDVIGGSSGFRRPGYVITAEPGITYTSKKVSVYSFVPIALKRNRTQSYADKIQTKKTGNYTIGDAAFADYAINVGASFKF
ncbi:MAG TPA: hypothetical protein VEZ55_12345 [Chitinophagaceae bacterium]|nr:hypothetical protein [Chitinophagaceae bacterium]